MKPLTTGKCAKFCGVAPRTLAKWIDSGDLKGFRIPGVMRPRRVMPNELRTFMQRHGMPIPEELEKLADG